MAETAYFKIGTLRSRNTNQERITTVCSVRLSNRAHLQRKNSQLSQIIRKIWSKC